MTQAPHPRTKARRGFAIAALLVALVGLGLPYAWQSYIRALGPLDLTAASNPSTVVVDREGRLLRAFTTSDGRWSLPVALGDTDPRFIALLTAYEDKRFFHHDGVDTLALTRAAGQFLTHRRIVSGGSTLTMQVARLLEPRTERSLVAKLRQMVRARQLEERLDKATILDLYLAVAPYGGNLQGLRAASLAYFGREPRRLGLAQAALLVALPQSPETRRPDRFPEAARIARDNVLDRAVTRGVIGAAEAKAAKAEPVPHERRAFPMLAPHAAEAAVAADPTRRVHHLTIDARLQGALQRLARDNASRLGRYISVAILVLDNASGRARAHVGGPDYFSVDRAGSMDMTQALRSPGSALKPFIYALAFENGIAHPETMLEDRPSRYGAYAPENFDLTYEGSVSARHALQRSLNVPAIALLNEVGPAQFLARLRNAGATIELPRDTPPGLSIGLGGLGIKLVDIARLYAGLAHGGEPPPIVERLDAAPPTNRARPIANPVAAWYVADILRGVPPPTNALGGRIAYKTGTSYGYRDAFAIGFDKNTTIAVWVGRPDNAAVPGLVGRQVAAPILFDAFARLGTPIEAIPPPRNVIVAAMPTLPPPLRRLRRDNPAPTAAAPLKIAYPPDGSKVDLGLQSPVKEALVLKAQGGVPPLTWLVNGIPAGQAAPRRQSSWTPDGAGFARISVIDATGATDTVAVRLQ